MTAPDKLTVEQCDRDAAADTWLARNGDALTAKRLRLGHLVDHWMVLALARHRQQAEARAEELVEALEEIAEMTKKKQMGRLYRLICAHSTQP